MSDWHMRTDTDTHSCPLCGAGWRGKAIPEERYKEVLQHFPPSAFEAAPEVSDEALSDGMVQKIIGAFLDWKYEDPGTPHDAFRAALRAAQEGGERERAL